MTGHGNWFVWRVVAAVALMGLLVVGGSDRASLLVNRGRASWRASALARTVERGARRPSA